MNERTINQINAIIARSGCDSWELSHKTTLYLSEAERHKRGYDRITYYRGGYGYPELCFVKERLEFNGYGVNTILVAYATPREFLAVLKTQKHYAGAWRNN